MQTGMSSPQNFDDEYKPDLENDFGYDLEYDYEANIHAWLFQEYEEDHSHEFMIRQFFYTILTFLDTNSIKLRSDEQIFYNQFVLFLYKYSSHKSYPQFYQRLN